MNGKKNGEGTFTFADGEYMKCIWKDGKPHGKGIVFKDGVEKKAEWNMGDITG